MPEIQWQDVAYEFIVIPNDEGIPPRQPANDVRLLLLEHAHELAGEGVGVPPFAAGSGSILRSGGGHDAPPAGGSGGGGLAPAPDGLGLPAPWENPSEEWSAGGGVGGTERRRGNGGGGRAVRGTQLGGPGAEAAPRAVGAAVAPNDEIVSRIARG